MTVQLFEVGGCVRDELLGLKSKDIDFTVVAGGGWDEMKSFLAANAFKVWQERPEFLTIRARFPDNYWLASGTPVKGLSADFVLARKEGEYTDGRRPDLVTPGTLEDDLRRRDFTVNALAKSENGEIIDLFGGREDLREGVLRAVGDPEARLREDALRALRAVRFTVTKALRPNADLMDALRSEWLPPLLSSVSVERKREELHKAFKHSTLETLEMIQMMTRAFREACFEDGLWLQPSLRT